MSVSRKNLWDECKKKYYYKYHVKLKPEEPEPFYFTYGKIIHKIAEEYIEKKGEFDLGQITESIVKGEIPIERNGDNPVYAPKIPSFYKARIPGNLKSIQNLTKSIGFDGELEWEFKYDLDPPNKKLMVGFIDRLIIKKDHAFIIDYKTTKRGSSFRKNKNTIKDDLQLRAYSKIVQEKFDIPAKNIMSALYFLEGGELVDAKFSQESLDEAKDILINGYDEIYNCDPKDAWGNVGKHCRFCDYKKVCPFYKKG